MDSEREEVLQNLRDAGCDGAEAQRFMALAEEGRRGEQLELLYRLRRRLLERVHLEERRIHCLDYLVYNLTGEGHGA